jgi:hypothetical protein
MNGLGIARVLKRMMRTLPLIVFSEYNDAFSECEGSFSKFGAYLCAGRELGAGQSNCVLAESLQKAIVGSSPGVPGADKLTEVFKRC